MFDFKFFLKPSLTKLIPNYHLKDKVITFTISLIIMYFFLFGILILIKLTDIFIIHKYGLSISKLILQQQNNHYFKYTTLFGFSSSLLLSVITEEIIFRKPLNLVKKNVIICFILFYLIFILQIFINPNLTSINNILKAIGLIAITTFLILKKQEFYENIKKYYWIYFYIITITFGIIHIGNFNDILPKKLIGFSIIFVLPQTLLGFFTGYIRLKNGINWSIGMHIIFNTPAFIMTALSNPNF